MDLRWMQAFVVLAEELHFTRAAERLEVAQPVLSQWIRKLEHEQKATLVERSTRAVRLTEAGKAALPHARAAVKASRQFARAASLNGIQLVGQVRLGYAGASSRPRLPLIARTVRHVLPGVELLLRSMTYGGAVPNLVESGELDVGFGRRPLSHNGLADRIFEYEQVLVAVASDHPLADRQEIDIREIQHEPWVVFPDAYGATVRQHSLRLAAQSGFIPKIAQEAPDSYTILDLVAAGVGVTLTVSSVAHVAGPDLRLIPLGATPHYLAATIVHSHCPGGATKAVLDVLEKLLPTPPEPTGILIE